MTRGYCLVAVLPALLAACAPNYSPDTYASSAVQQASKVEQGIIVGARLVVVQASGAAGAVTGATAGGIAGSQAPVGGVGTALTALGGSLVGGMVGAGIERAGGDTTATEYIVRKMNGEMVSVTQKDAVPLQMGSKVLVIAGSQARIVVDYTVAPEALKEAAVREHEGGPEAAAAPAPAAPAAIVPSPSPSPDAGTAKPTVAAPGEAPVPP